MSRPKKRRSTMILCVLLVALATGALPRRLRAAGPWYVAPTGSDSYPCNSPVSPCATINGAIAKASDGDTIYVTTGTYTGTGGQVVYVDRPIVLSGGWNAAYSQQTGASIIDGGHARRGILVDNGSALTLDRFTVRNGSAAMGAGIESNGDLTINNSAIISNTSPHNGSGIRSSLSDLRINNSTISGNVLTSPYSGWVGGAGIEIFSGQTVSINSSTIANNVATGGGAMAVGILGTSNTHATVQNSIIARNLILATGQNVSCGFGFTSLGYNVFDDTSCLACRSTADYVTLDPQLGPLQVDPSGFATHPLLNSSPGINAGNPVACTDDSGAPLLTDQRGISRVERCDVGAYETSVTNTAVPRTWYVAPSGLDQNDCASTLTACATIRAALGRAVSGDTVSVLPGTYSPSSGETFPITMTPGVRLIGAGSNSTIISGQGDRPVIYLDATVYDVSSDTVIGSLEIQNGDVGIRLHAKDFRVAEPAVTNARVRNNNTGIYITTGGQYEFGAHVSMTISNTEVSANRQVGIQALARCDSSPFDVAVRIVGSTVQGNGSHGVLAESTASSSSGRRMIMYVERSRIGNNGGDGVLFTGTYQGWGWLQVDSTHIDSNTGYGLRWSQGLNGSNFSGAITNTVITSNRAGGIYLDDQSPYGPAGTLRIINATLLNNREYGIYWKRSSSETKPLIANTILWNTAADDLYSTGANWTTNEILYSDIEDGDLSGQSGNFAVAPRVTQDGHLAACSPAMDAGTSANAPSIDIDGELRPQGTAVDVGADEYEAPCWLILDKSVSSDTAQLGDILTYTIVLTNSTAITPLQVLLTDVLPSQITYQPSSLSASLGEASFGSGAISWTGMMTPSAALTIRFQGRASSGRITSCNTVYANANDSLYLSPEACTAIAPTWAFIPAVFRTYCPPSFFDDFGNPSGWPVGDDTAVLAHYLDGEYRVLSKRPFLFLFRSPACAHENYVVEADMRWDGAPGSDIGLLFGVNSEFTQYYFADINTDYQAYAIFYRSPTGFLTVAPPAQTTAIRTGNQSNHLKITRNGSQIVFEINGQVVGTWYHTAISGLTGTGLAMAPYDDTPMADARFDNFRVTAITHMVDRAASAPTGAKSTRLESTWRIPSEDVVPAFGPQP